MPHCEHTESYFYERIYSGMSKLVWNQINDQNIKVEKDISIPENNTEQLQSHGAHLNQGLNYRKKVNLS